MSESDKLSLSSRLTTIVVETSSVKHKNYRQDLPDESYSEQHQRLSKAPAVPPVAEELKNIEEAAVLDDDEKKDLKTVKIDKLKHRDAASHSKPRGQSPEKIATEALNSTKHKVSLAQPIPTGADAKAAPSVEQGADKDGLEATSTYSVLPEQQPEAAAVETQGVWSDDEEAGGLPRDGNGSLSPPVSLNSSGDFRSPSITERCSRTSEKKNEISWDSNAYLNKINLPDLLAKNHGWILVPKASMIAAKPGMPIQVPSGITICLPVKKQLSAKSQTRGEGDKGKAEKIPPKGNFEIRDRPQLEALTNNKNTNGFRSFRDKCDRMWSRFKTNLVW